MLALSILVAIPSYAVFYLGMLAIRGYPALIGSPKAYIGFLDVVLPSRLGTLQQYLTAGPQQGSNAPPPTNPITGVPGGQLAPTASATTMPTSAQGAPPAPSGPPPAEGVYYHP